mmetsp:Transcript_88657/g.255765  ORF Transcript_88657/g.255765 Transcript_88657/m.255765 type:complete len:367 (+) Transcript_88657:1233-2333(+)
MLARNLRAIKADLLIRRATQAVGFARGLVDATMFLVTLRALLLGAHVHLRGEGVAQPRALAARALRGGALGGPKRDHGVHDADVARLDVQPEVLPLVLHGHHRGDGVVHRRCLIGFVVDQLGAQCAPVPAAVRRDEHTHILVRAADEAGLRGHEAEGFFHPGVVVLQVRVVSGHGVAVAEVWDHPELRADGIGLLGAHVPRDVHDEAARDGRRGPLDVRVLARHMDPLAIVGGEVQVVCRGGGEGRALELLHHTVLLWANEAQLGLLHLSAKDEGVFVLLVRRVEGRARRHLLAVAVQQLQPLGLDDAFQLRRLEDVEDVVVRALAVQEVAEPTAAALAGVGNLEVDFLPDRPDFVTDGDDRGDLV